MTNRKVCIFGATGKTGLKIIEQGLNMGLEITAYARNSEKLLAYSDKVTIVEGMLEDKQQLETAIINQDIIISALGTVDRKPNTVLSDGTSNIMDVMNSNKVKRFVVITSLGCRESVKQVKSFLFRELVVKRLAKEIWADKNWQEDLIEASGLDYTIVRPGGLRDAPLTLDYKVFSSRQSIPKKTMISRSDVANFVLKIIDDPKTYKETYILTG